MIEKYRFEVLKFYEEKKAAGELSVNLIHPTCAKLRNECLLIFRERCNKYDLQTLKTFIERPFDKEIYETAIRRCDPDKSKPLNNYLKWGIKSHEKNIELLAWLIDFRPRPYSKFRLLPSCNIEFPLQYAVGTAQYELPTTAPMPISTNNQNTIAKYRFSEKSTTFLFRAKKILKKLKNKPDLLPNKINIQKTVTLEYPTGIKVSVDASDIKLIEQLLRL